ncbi:Hypothetical protein NCS54_00596700 [Fusarium falciforme]|uniref:SSCRP protein n=1 Tax=Fusarium falciforme TaxID=195108 RepID=A0A9W8RK36_9HYPO|nr:Hypothetical protein NCS54_00596700 [Fusarium falciforme]KAJ4198234.1 hypothetical protein NW755_000921 [Fusarium falciforme]KAJ4200618.1 hypothetical protein NW767_007239 [Fusarium falciforme]KAJ4261918.1 hypothetical protein NW757_000189 [Fusarium falciforme]WAO88610.1 Hypothetical protein NCS54_00596700 [Fusarium falciforme]
MKLSSVAASVLVSASAVSASPIHKRELGGVLMCTGANATGTCHYEVYKLEKCHQLPPPFYKNVKTFAPDGENFACYPRVYDCGGICKSPTGCTFGKVDFNYEHKFNISAIGWDTLFQSFDCFEKRKPSPLP